MLEAVIALVITIVLCATYQIGYRAGTKHGRAVEFLRIMLLLSPQKIIPYVLKQDEGERVALFKAFKQVVEWIGEKDKSERRDNSGRSV